MSAGRYAYRPRRVRRSEREERRVLIERQVADGSLTIRPMTGAERERWGVPAADDEPATIIADASDGAAA